MRHSAIRLLILSQVSFLSTFALCLWLEPIVWVANIGVSHFGTLPGTLPIFVAGLAVGSSLLVWGTFCFTESLGPLNKMAPWLRLIPLFLLGIVLTPYGSTPAITEVHKIIADVLFLFQFFLSLWISRELKWARFTDSLLLLEVAGALIALLSVNHIVAWEIQGQLLFQIAFGALMVQSAMFILKQHGTENQKASIKSPKGIRQKVTFS